MTPKYQITECESSSSDNPESRLEFIDPSVLSSRLIINFSALDEIKAAVLTGKQNWPLKKNRNRNQMFSPRD